MPATSDGGRSTTVGRPEGSTAAASETTMRTTGSPDGSSRTCVPRRSSLGTPGSATFVGSGGIGHGRSRTRATGSPSRSARVTPATSPAYGQPSVSSAWTPSESVAVVRTAVAPSPSASRDASAFAPPPCPPTSGTQNRPPSSTTTTPGSVFFDASSGAIRRVVAPRARWLTMRSHSAHARGSPSDAGPS